MVETPKICASGIKREMSGALRSRSHLLTALSVTMQLTGQLFLGQLVLFAQLLEKAAEGRILHGGTTFVLCVHSIAEGGENGNRREVEAVGNQQ